MNLLPIDMEHVKKAQKFAPIIAATVKAGSYDWLKKDVLAIGYITYLGAKKDVPEDAVYEMLKVNLSPEGIKYLKNNSTLWDLWNTKTYIEENEAFALEGQKLHPGAVKYWTEKGVKLPPSILP